jgi:hypothetical protein
MNCGRTRDVPDSASIEPWWCGTCEEETVKSYAERQIFSDRATAMWCDAVDLIKRISPTWGNELRCHELARAAQIALGKLKFRGEPYKLYVVDGRLWSIEHSWLLYEVSGPPLYREYTTKRILDVYCPGRLPQVQLLDGDHFAIARGYEAGETRTDIKLDIVEKLVHEMHHPKS